MDSDGDVQVPSNVTRIARAIKPIGTDDKGNEVPQIVFYNNGVGTGSNFLEHYIGGATGNSITEHIKDAYSFICMNYNSGDEIFILGFSRGAFTARSISSLIRSIGLLTSKGLNDFVEIFQDWQYQNKPGWMTKYPDRPWPGHKPPVNEQYVRDLLRKEMTRPDIPIKCVGVWDTVGALGIPQMALLPQPPSKDFSFVNTEVEPNIEYAFQALALDEHRRSFSPTIWEKPEGQELPRQLKQCWFPGVHADIGGSYADTDLSNLTLCWMVSNLDPLLDIKHDYVWEQVRLSIEKYKKESIQQTPKRAPTGFLRYPGFRPWGLGKIHNSMSPFYRLGGSKIRTPNEYRRVKIDQVHGTLWYILTRFTAHLGRLLGMSKEDDRPRLTNTNETVHSCVRIRMGKGGLGYNDHGKYESEALSGWTFYGTETNPDTPYQATRPGEMGAMKQVVWRKKFAYPNSKDVQTLEMKEDIMGAFEMKILQLYPDIEAEFGNIRPGNHHQVVKRASTAPMLMNPNPPKRVGDNSDGTTDVDANRPVAWLDRNGNEGQHMLEHGDRMTTV